MKPVSIAKFKAQLSRYLRAVRRGQEVVVADRDRPVARVIPYLETTPFKVAIRKPSQDPSEIATLKIPPLAKGRVDSLSSLLEDRRRDR